MINIFIFTVSIMLLTIWLLWAFQAGKEAIAIVVVLQAICANLFVQKQIILFGLNATASDVFAIAGLIGINLIQSKFGENYAAKVNFYGFISLIFFNLLAVMEIAYIPSSYDKADSALRLLFMPLPKICIVSMILYFLTQKLNIWLFSKLQYKNIAVRRIVSFSISELFDTVGFTLLGLHNLVDNPWEIIFISYVIKFITICISVLFLHKIYYWLLLRYGWQLPLK